jgi:hypothetical protein
MKRATIIAISAIAVVILAIIGITRTTTPAEAVSGTTRAYAVMIHNQTAEQEMTAAYSWEPKPTGGWRITDRSMIWTSTPARTGDRLSMSISAVKNGGNTVLHATKVSGLTTPVITTGNVSGGYGGGTITITLNDGGTLTLTPSSSTVHLIVKEGK